MQFCIYVFVYTNIRSVSNKHEEISDFLQQQNRQTCFIVTETWINDNQKIPLNFLSNNHHFVHQSRSKLTQLTRGGGVGIWVENTFKHKIRNDLNSIYRSFFESLWLEIQAPFKEKLLVNVSCCSNKNLGEFFLEELTSEISGAFSITDNVILFGDYNINFFNQNEKELLTEFASNNGLEIVNKITPTWTNGNQETLFDRCLTTKHQIFDTTVIEQFFGSDHFTQVFLSSLDIDYENKTQFFYRDTSKFTRANLNKKIASADWSFMYQQNNANSTFEKFSIV